MTTHQPYSLWDYLKGRVAAWLPAAWRPQGWEPLPPEVLQAALEQTTAPEVRRPDLEGQPPFPEGASVPQRPSAEASVQLGPLPVLWAWRGLVPLGLALLAQRALEPPGRNLALGLVFYTLAAGALVWAVRHDEVALPSAPATVWQADDGRLARPGWLWPGAALAVAAFVLFGGNRFTGLNLSLWLTALGLLVGAFWRPEPGLAARLRKVWETLRQREWTVRLRRWHLALGVLVGLALFFRLYRLAEVPAEMFSDHAEKLLDVADVLAGQWRIFFPRNTGREAIQMYLTAFIAGPLGVGLNFLSLKIGMALMGLFSLPFLYGLGVELADRRTAFWATAFAAVAYWPNVIARVALRFALYPAFTAPTLYFLVRGLRHGRRNDFILAGLFLGLGLHGYSPFRLVPLAVVVAVGLYLLHEGRRAPQRAGRAVVGLALVAFFAFVVFLPLFRYLLGHWDMFFYRSMTRLGQLERPYPAPPWQIFLVNLWRAWVMPWWDNGQIWVHSVPHRPALDWVSAALYALGLSLLGWRYLQRRRWEDLFLLLAVPLLMLPSVLSLAFPEENPSLNRTGGAIVPVFLIVGMGLEGVLRRWGPRRSPARSRWGAVLGGILLLMAAVNNYGLVFRQYDEQFRLNAWNTSEMGAVIQGFTASLGREDRVWVVPYPYWVDTRLVAINAGVFPRITDYALWPEQLPDTVALDGPKLFLLKPEDADTLALLQSLYPSGRVRYHESPVPGKAFLVYFVP